MKDTTDTAKAASFLDIHLEVDSEWRLRTKLYDKRDDFNFTIVKIPYIQDTLFSKSGPLEGMIQH